MLPLTFNEGVSKLPSFDGLFYWGDNLQIYNEGLTKLLISPQHGQISTKIYHWLNGQAWLHPVFKWYLNDLKIN